MFIAWCLSKAERQENQAFLVTAIQESWFLRATTGSEFDITIYNREWKRKDIRGPNPNPNPNPSLASEVMDR